MTAESIKTRVLFPLAVVVVLVLGGFVLATYLLNRHQAQDWMAELDAKVEGDFHDHVAEDTEKLDGLLAAIGQNERLRSALGAKDRKALLELALPIFKKVNFAHEVTHFYFTGPDRRCLLRVHNVDRHGDLIERITTKEAERTGKRADGMELGPYGTFTLRVVHPWFDGKRLIGFVELGHEIGHITEVLRRALDVRLCMLIKKKYLKRDPWEEGMEKILHRKGNWDQFPECVAIDEIPNEMPGEFYVLLTARGIDHTPRKVKMASGGRRYEVTFLPLEDAGKKDVARLVVLCDVTDQYNASVRLVLTVAIGCLAVGALIFGFSLYYLGRPERRTSRGK